MTRYAFKFFEKRSNGRVVYPFAGYTVPKPVLQGTVKPPYIRGRLEYCVSGYHACATADQLGMWGFTSNRDLYLVKLYGYQSSMAYRNDKVIARCYEVVGRIGPMSNDVVNGELGLLVSRRVRRLLVKNPTMTPNKIATIMRQLGLPVGRS